MTIIAPNGSKATLPAARDKPADGAYTRPAVGTIELALAPPPGEIPQRADGPVRLSGTARLGAVLLLIFGLLLQRTLLPLLPYGPADLITVLVAVLAVYAGPVTGCISGFGIGLMADVLSDHALGRLAAVLCVVGYVCGLVPTQGRNRFLIAWLTAGAACVLTPLLFALTGAFVGDNRAAGALLLTRCLAGLCYGLLLAPIVYPLTRRLLAPRARRSRFRRQGRPRPASR